MHCLQHVYFLLISREPAWVSIGHTDFYFLLLKTGDETLCIIAGIPT